MSVSDISNLTYRAAPTERDLLTSPATQRPLLAVRDFGVHFVERGNRVEVVSALNYNVFQKSTLGIIGESGSGKSISCRALLGVLPSGATATGSVRYFGQELLGLAEPEMRRHRGRSIAMVFQDAERALNPTMQIGHQISEAVCAHDPISRRAAQHRALELLHLLGLPQPRKLLLAYAHELSGGMRQRVMIAIAIAAKPTLLIADEPTSALDAATAIGILRLLMDLQRQLDMALILISHDLRLVADFSDSVLVMQSGRAVEYASTRRLMTEPQTEYAKALLGAILPAAVQCKTDEVSTASRYARTSSRGREYGATGMSPLRRAPRERTRLLEVRNLVQEFPTRRVTWSNCPPVQVICDVSFDLLPGEILGIVGETGAGKSTLVRTLMQKPPPKSGSVTFLGHDLTRLRGRRLVDHRRDIMMIFQDPFSSLNPQWRVAEIVEEPLVGHRYGDRKKRVRRVQEVLDLVDLPFRTYGHRRPGQLSVGQCQRVAIARALAIDPKLLICDEALSSLDSLVQQHIASLFQWLRAKFSLAFIIISHDIARVREISNRVGVMYLGKICEIGPARSVCDEPFHPYMDALRDSMVSLHVPRSLEGARPTLSAPPSGCRFQTRCDRAQDRCRLEEPRLQLVADDHLVACHYPMRPWESGR